MSAPQSKRVLRSQKTKRAIIRAEMAKRARISNNKRLKRFQETVKI